MNDKEKKFANKIFLIAATAVVVIAFDVMIAIVHFSSPHRFHFVWEKEKAAQSAVLKENNIKENPTAIKPENTASTTLVRPIGDDDYVWGEKGSPVKIIVYSDFQCPFCATYADTLKQAETEFTNKIVVAFRHFPLPGHEEAMNAALASECAGEQGKFLGMYDQLFNDNKANDFSKDRFNADAKNLGLDMKKFNQCLKTGKYGDKIQSQIDEANKLGVIGAPTTFINGDIVPGARPYDDFTDSQGNKAPGLKTLIIGHLPQPM